MQLGGMMIASKQCCALGRLTRNYKKGCLCKQQNRVISSLEHNLQRKLNIFT